MKTFKNYLYCNCKSPIYGKVYHNKNLNECMFSDGRFMIISKELFDPCKDIEALVGKKKLKEFDYSNFNYRRVIYADSEYETADLNLFARQVNMADNSLFDAEVPYEDALCDDMVYMKDFDLVLSLPIIHIVNEFIHDNGNLSMTFKVNKNDKTKNCIIEARSDDFLTEGEIVNMIVFMPCTSDTRYFHVAEGDKMKDDCGTYVKNIEKSYSWSDMANEFTSRGIPHDVVRNLADVPSAMIFNRPLMDIFKFDKYLHDKYGDYESEGKSMKDMFVLIFGADSDKMAWYFGINRDDNDDNNKGKEKYYDNANKVGQ